MSETKAGVPVIIENDGSSQRTGTRLKIGDIDVPNLACVSFEHRAGKEALVTAEINATDGFSIRLPAEVVVNVMMFPRFEFEIDQSQTDRDTVLYTVRERKSNV